MEDLSKMSLAALRARLDRLESAFDEDGNNQSIAKEMDVVAAEIDRRETTESRSRKLVEGLDIKGPFGNEGMFGARVPRKVNRVPSSPSSMRLDDIDDPRLDEIVDRWHDSDVDDNILDFCQEVADSSAGQPDKTPENLQRAIEAFRPRTEQWLVSNDLPVEYAEPLIADSFDTYMDLSTDDEGVV